MGPCETIVATFVAWSDPLATIANVRNSNRQQPTCITFAKVLLSDVGSRRSISAARSCQPPAAARIIPDFHSPACTCEGCFSIRPAGKLSGLSGRSCLHLYNAGTCSNLLDGSSPSGYAMASGRMGKCLDQWDRASGAWGLSIGDCAMAEALTTAIVLKALSKPIEDIYALGKSKLSTELQYLRNERFAKDIAKRLHRIDRVKTFWFDNKETDISSFYYPSRIRSDGSSATTVSDAADCCFRSATIRNSASSGLSRSSAGGID